LKPLNSIVVETPPSGIRRFFDVASRMQNVVSLGVGEPDFATPWRIRESAIYALERGYTTYTSNAGLISLRKAIVQNIEERYGVSYSPETECIVTVGVSEGVDIAVRALLNPGDEVIYHEPSYVSYDPTIRFAGGAAIAVPTTAADGFRVSAAALEAAVTPRTKALFLSSPCNPTGAVQQRSDLEQIVDVAVRHDLYLIVDEVYDRLTYHGVHTCMASIPAARPRTILLNGFSKAYAMTGWRLGYVCAPPEITEQMLKIHQYTMLCAPHVAQYAAIEALQNGESDVRAMVTDYDRRRRFFVRGLEAMGLRCHAPDGAFYAFPSIASTGMTAEAFADELLQEERVAVVPGTAFGAGGEGHVRCSYATSLAQLDEALRRIRRFLERRGCLPVGQDGRPMEVQA
jgi:aminotransferase